MTGLSRCGNNDDELLRRRGITRMRLCESGCGCRYGTDDPDRLDCACDGPCCYAEHDEWFGPGCTYHDEVRS